MDRVYISDLYHHYCIRWFFKSRLSRHQNGPFVGRREPKTALDTVSSGITAGLCCLAWCQFQCLLAALPKSPINSAAADQTESCSPSASWPEILQIRLSEPPRLLSYLIHAIGWMKAHYRWLAFLSELRIRFSDKRNSDARARTLPQR